jgi:hypothetical protein
MTRPNPNFVVGLCVMITKLLDSTSPKHSNTKILDWDLFAQLLIGSMFKDYLLEHDNFKTIKPTT